MRARKKPVEVDVWEFQHGRSGYPRGKGIVFRDQFCYSPCQPGVHAIIPTREGEMVACPGDWIITGVKGEVYPCKPDIFAETYDLLPQPPPDPPAERTDPEAPQGWQGPHLHRCPDCPNEHWDRQPKAGEAHAGDCICADCGYGL